MTVLYLIYYLYDQFDSYKHIIFLELYFLVVELETIINKLSEENYPWEYTACIFLQIDYSNHVETDFCYSQTMKM